MKNLISSWNFVIMKPVMALDFVLEAGNLLGGHKFLTLTLCCHCVVLPSRWMHVPTTSTTYNGISWTYTALIMVFWCQRKTVRLFLKVKISFSVWAMIVLGGELASEVSRRRTELASKPPKTIMANTENDIWTLRNTPNCYLFGNRNTIIRRCRSKTKLSWVIKPEKNYGQKKFFGSVKMSKSPRICFIFAPTSYGCNA